MKQAYSDALVDKPILEHAKESFIVVGDQIIPYDQDYKFKNKTIKYLRDYDFLNILVISLVGLLSLVIFTLFFKIFFDFLVAFLISYFLSFIISYILAVKYLFKNKLIINTISMVVYYLANFIIILLCVKIFQYLKCTLPLLSLIYFIISYFSLYFINKERGI